MKYLAEIIFGKDPVRKFHNNEPLNDFEKIINLKKYTFETWVERNAFYKGLGEAMGWLEFEVIKEYEEKDSKEEKEDDDKFDYWAFIEKYYPKYYHCDNVLLSDILTRKLVGEEICEQDEENIKDWDIRNELFEVDKELLCKAFENYFNIAYPENLIPKN
ncbi:hypothetical protein [Flavobacterium piscis]|uniref:Uncharacterized protein n=1 Tax=Flavobacterium piscis TaxID=1114874 RepID=A0ABX2XBW2_9FLAO|nr:hypothetical protein [Flavobacterium piscis]OCB69216.1 hypothetical protein FLP_21165 [Flavobacterium piscis]